MWLSEAISLDLLSFRAPQEPEKPSNSLYCHSKTKIDKTTSEIESGGPRARFFYEFAMVLGALGTIGLHLRSLGAYEFRINFQVDFRSRPGHPRDPKYPPRRGKKCEFQAAHQHPVDYRIQATRYKPASKPAEYKGCKGCRIQTRYKGYRIEDRANPSQPGCPSKEGLTDIILYITCYCMLLHFYNFWGFCLLRKLV